MKITRFFEGLGGFLLLWSSQAVSSLGTAMTNYALVIWTHAQTGSASGITMLTLCSFLPTILFRFAAGALTDHWNKKRVMLVCDALAACGTIAVFALYRLSALTSGRLYLITFLLSLMNAFQAPASHVAVSLLIPKEQYTRAGALQSFSGSAVSILAPALGSALFAWGGLEAVLCADLISFAAALPPLALLRLPAKDGDPADRSESFLETCLDGIRCLLGRRSLMKLILFFTAINFFAKLGGDGMLAPFILAKTGGNQRILGFAQSAVSLGVLAGSTLMMASGPTARRTRAVFAACALTFLTGNILVSVSQSAPVWYALIFISYLSAAVMNVHLGALMRLNVPVHLQGRIFAARDTIQNIAIPLGLYLGGRLADHVFEPMMHAPNLLSPLFGSGDGAGIAFLFFLAGTAGFVLSLICLFRRTSSELDR